MGSQSLILTCVRSTQIQKTPSLPRCSPVDHASSTFYGITFAVHLWNVSISSSSGLYDTSFQVHSSHLTLLCEFRIEQLSARTKKSVQAALLWKGEATSKVTLAYCNFITHQFNQCDISQSPQMVHGKISQISTACRKIASESLIIIHGYRLEQASRLGTPA